MERLARKVGFDLPEHMDPEGTAAHRNDYSKSPPLSEKARLNLREWYRQDFEFYLRCEDWICSQEAGTEDHERSAASTLSDA